MPDICVDGTKLPAQEELDDAKAAFEADWGEVDKVLYGICREYPAHDDRGHLVAKLAIVGRTCSAGVERCVTPGPGQQGLMLVAEHVWGTAVRSTTSSPPCVRSQSR